MTIAVGQHSSATSTGTGAVSTTGVNTSVSGSSFLAVFTGSNGAFAPTFSDTFTNNYNTGTPIANVTDTAGGEQIWAYLCTNGTGGTGHQIICTGGTGSSFPGAYLLEITGGALSSLLDTTNTANITSGGVFTNQLTTAFANDLVISFVETTSGVTWTPSTGLTKIESQAGAPGAASAMGWVLATTTGSWPANTPTWIGSGSPTTGALITLAFKNAGASGNTATIAWVK